MSCGGKLAPRLRVIEKQHAVDLGHDHSYVKRRGLHTLAAVHGTRHENGVKDHDRDLSVVVRVAVVAVAVAFVIVVVVVVAVVV